MVNSMTKEFQHNQIYSHEELVERSVDFEKLITALSEFTSVPKSMRTISTEKTKLARLAGEIYEIVRLNKNVNQDNVNTQLLLEL